MRAVRDDHFPAPLEAPFQGSCQVAYEDDRGVLRHGWQAIARITGGAVRVMLRDRDPHGGLFTVTASVVTEA
ncbi:hypothetical protein [Streptomyces sp. NPDC086787]|uniref:hypothetical protein n=1 Tax=Streptomyces sp. NPDC086787 TaxID=3365759 RepID=UPI00382BA851